MHSSTKPLVPSLMTPPSTNCEKGIVAPPCIGPRSRSKIDGPIRLLRWVKVKRRARAQYSFLEQRHRNADSSHRHLLPIYRINTPDTTSTGVYRTPLLQPYPPFDKQCCTAFLFLKDLNTVVILLFTIGFFFTLCDPTSEIPPFVIQKLEPHSFS
ncbi:uncharacterized protein EI97DRAFT_209642 [Westerdykella ornata]|uniref:Uncharacterized protein n=1 Tax=Westerdykella ornata TaxID=318751 RepID=A0A6A6J776_WESOR|nr:uncharacterized protein EI97DRAFT_209642 [Westerdykella ornata]KAF2272430.1 hypothetical protein EI97DRAFT_209642 [Westerdykella ornata]